MVYNRNRGFTGVVKNISLTETEGRIEAQDVYQATLEGTYPVHSEGEVVFTVEQFYASGNNTGSITRIDTGSTANATHVNYYWTCPNDVHNVSIVAIGGGASGLSVPDAPYTNAPTLNIRIAGGGGGALAYSNEMPVSAGKTYLIQVGKGGGYNIDAKGVVYATSVGTMTTTDNPNGVLSNQTPNAGGGAGDFLGVDGGDSGIRNGTSNASFLIKADGGFVAKNIKEIVNYIAPQNTDAGNYRWGINLASSSGGATSAPYYIDPSIISISGGGYGGEGGGGQNIHSLGYDFDDVGSEVSGGGGAGGYGTDGTTNHYITIIKAVASGGKFQLHRTEGITEGAIQNSTAVPTYGYDDSGFWSSDGINMLGRGTIVFDWSDDSFTNGNHQIKIGYNREGTSSGGSAGDKEISATSGTVLGVHDSVDDTTPQGLGITIQEYTVDTVNKRTILKMLEASPHSQNIVLYTYCPNHTGMGFPIRIQRRSGGVPHFDDMFGGYQYYFKGNGQGGHGGSHTHIGSNYSPTGHTSSYEHILMFPHFGLSGGGGGGGSIMINKSNSSTYWFGQQVAGGVSTFPTANSVLMAGGGGGTSIFGLDATINEATADIVQKCLDYSNQDLVASTPSAVRQASNIGSTNGSAGMSLFTGNSFDASASDTILLGRMANAGIDGSVAGTHLLGTHGGDAFPRNSFNPQSYEQISRQFIFLGFIQGRGQSGTNVTTDQGWQETSFSSSGNITTFNNLGNQRQIRLLFMYQNGTTGTSYQGDIQIDRVRFVYNTGLVDSGNYYNTTYNFSNNSSDGFERNNDSAHSSTAFSESNYDNMNWGSINTSTILAGFWNEDTGGTSSGGTGSNTDGSGSTTGGYLYVETSGSSTAGRWHWLRSPIVNLGTIFNLGGIYLHSVHFYHARIGSNVGRMNVYLVAEPAEATMTSIPDNARKGACGGMFGGGGGGAVNRRGGDGQNGAVRIIWGNNRNFPYNAR